MSADSLKQMFFVECEDLLEALAEGLQQLEDGSHDEETLHAIFRAVHSIKGTAGAFGFDTLVAFTHHFETVLDLIRSGEIEVDGERLRLLFRSSDILADLVDLARQEDAGVPAAMEAVQSQLEELGGGPVTTANAEEGMATGDGTAAAVGNLSFEPLAFEPLALDTGPIVPGAETYVLRFAPDQTFFRNGHDLGRLLEELAKLGALEVCADAEGLPPLAAFDPSLCYLRWDLTLETEATEVEIFDLFMFLEDFVEIRKVDTGAHPGQDDHAAQSPPISSAVGAPTELGSQAPDGQDAGASAPHAAPGDALPNLGSSQSAAPDPATAQPAPPTASQLAADAPSVPPSPNARSGPAPGAATQGSSAPGGAASGGAKQPTLRVEPERVDRLINTVGELIINQAVISQRISASGVETDPDLQGDLDDFQHLAREIQEGVMAIRAQPVKPLFQRMQRIVRETTEGLGKNVVLVTEGENTEVDKTLVERLADPLTHMIRNAIDHGIEMPDARAAAGKPERGTIQLSAAHRSGHVMIEIADDGAGVNRPRVFQKAVENGLISPDAKLTESEIDNLLFMPGFSTAAEVTNLSGRGVGMDVVKTAIGSLGGRITINSIPGGGTTFSISMPLTLAVMDGMVVHVAGETMVVPLSSIVETIRPKSSDLKPIGRDGLLLSIRGTYVPVVNLSAMLGLTHGEGPPQDGVFVLVRSDLNDLVALAVESISDQRQVVIKSLEGNYGAAIPGISAATILGDGRVALIIDTEAILSQVRQTAPDLAPFKEVAHDQASALG